MSRRVVLNAPITHKRLWQTEQVRRAHQVKRMRFPPWRFPHRRRVTRSRRAARELIGIPLAVKKNHRQGENDFAT